MRFVREGQGEEPADIKENKEPERDGNTPAIGFLLPGCDDYCNYRDRYLKENGNDLQKIRK